MWDLIVSVPIIAYLFTLNRQRLNLSGLKMLKIFSAQMGSLEYCIVKAL